jgi:hypothetical protein
MTTNLRIADIGNLVPKCRHCGGAVTTPRYEDGRDMPYWNFYGPEPRPFTPADFHHSGKCVEGPDRY